MRDAVCVNYLRPGERDRQAGTLLGKSGAIVLTCVQRRRSLSNASEYWEHYGSFSGGNPELT